MFCISVLESWPACIKHGLIALVSFATSNSTCCCLDKSTYRLHVHKQSHALWPRTCRRNSQSGGRNEINYSQYSVLFRLDKNYNQYHVKDIYIYAHTLWLYVKGKTFATSICPHVLDNKIKALFSKNLHCQDYLRMNNQIFSCPHIWRLHMVHFGCIFKKSTQWLYSRLSPLSLYSHSRWRIETQALHMWEECPTPTTRGLISITPALWKLEPIGSYHVWPIRR